MKSKKRAKRAELQQLYDNFMEGLKIFEPEMYEDIQKEQQAKRAKRKGVQPQELEMK